MTRIINKDLQKYQDLLQGIAESDSNGDSDSSESDNETTNLSAPAVCEGDGGCGELFSKDQPGSDHRYSQLFAPCYKKNAGMTPKLLRSNIF
mgnify:CR=1 FL=1